MVNFWKLLIVLQMLQVLQYNFDKSIAELLPYAQCNKNRPVIVTALFKMIF